MAVRTTSDIIVALENSVNQLKTMIQNQDFNLKILSQKLSLLLEDKNKEPVKDIPKKQTIFAEAVDTKSSNIIRNDLNENKSVEIDSRFNVKVEQSSVGNRRTSRSESYVAPPQVAPIQIPNGTSVQVVSNQPTGEFVDMDDVPNFENYNVDPNSLTPISQRVVDSNGKALFMCDVNVFLPDGSLAAKTRTSGTGKWTASLKPGTYKVVIKKRNMLTKEASEITNNVQISGSSSVVELDPIIMK